MINVKIYTFFHTHTHSAHQARAEWSNFLFMKLIEKKSFLRPVVKWSWESWNWWAWKKTFCIPGLVRTPREPVIMDDFQIFIRFICKWWKFNSIQIGSRRGAFIGSLLTVNLMLDALHGCQFSRGVNELLQVIWGVAVEHMIIGIILMIEKL